MMSFLRTCLVASCLAGVAGAQASSAPSLHAITDLPWRMEGPVIHAAVADGEPFTVAGPRGIVVGQQQGPFEAWILPVKILSHLTIQADVEGYSVPLDLNSMARELEVRPDRTIITYSHIAVTVRQIMFAPENAPDGTGAVVLFQVDAVRPVTLTIRFTPELREMWPKPSSGNPSTEWVAEGSSGHYVLHTDFNNLAAAVALPGATSGIMAPYQERPQVHPLELILHVDPVKDHGRLYPLLMALGQTTATASNAALAAKLSALNEGLPALYAAHAAAYARQEQQLTSIVTPDKQLDEDLTWAETSIGQLRARTLPIPSQPQGEMGMVAGYYASGDSARPGFGWYFGRDTLFTIDAMNSYGDQALAKTALEFLLRRQRADGKIMHEFSQTAGSVDWASLPYEYAAADATPLMLTALLDYVRSSGDVGFLREHRDQIFKAWQFETTHDADGDGIYDNAQGTGWVESWPPGMPKQEIYLALFDEQASRAMAQLAEILGDAQTASAAGARAARIHATIEREYYQPETKTYAFSRNQGGVLDRTPTIFPAVAWWDTEGALDHPDESLRRWASHEFATDWGARDVSEASPLYDPISYHQGSVWPLFTGWVALAQYRSGHPLAGYQATMQNADLTYAQDPGAVTELLSGAFYEPFGRSTSHQLWSSAMVVTPILRGIFGIDLDALHQTLRVTPHLPATWPEAEVRQLHVGGSVINLHYQRERETMSVTIEGVSGPAIHFAGGSNLQRTPLPAIEVEVPHGLPLRGSRTSQMKVTGEVHSTRSLQLTLEGLAGSEATLTVVQNAAEVKPTAEGGELTADRLRIKFGPGEGYVTQTVSIRW
jgi:glycogen debranching enzyme